MARGEVVTRMIYADVECYPNWWSLCLLDGDTATHYGLAEIGAALGALAERTVGTFNGRHYDLPMIAYAAHGASEPELHALSGELIGGTAWWVALERRGVAALDWIDHVDIAPVAPLKAPLKLYGARLHTRTLRELPYDPQQPVDAAQQAELRAYCETDCRVTAELAAALRRELGLRDSLGKRYGIDCRSLADQQIGEAVVGVLMGSLPPPGPPAREYRYTAPDYIAFESPALNALLERVQAVAYPLLPSGRYGLPGALAGATVTVGDGEYRLGIGGLHSTESAQTLTAGGGWALTDLDVASYYPHIILRDGLAPRHLDAAEFGAAYRALVDARLAAKRSGDKTTSDGLKIAVNGLYGKFASRHSRLYSPDVSLRVGLTGQLALLMLIEQLEAAGVRVASANTDGVLCRYRERDAPLRELAQWEWEQTTGYTLERTRLKARYARDVNNYLAVPVDGEPKGKGVWARADLRKNPVCSLAFDAARLYITEGVPVRDTVRACVDVRRMVAVRKVQGGALWRGEPIGEIVRWYYAASGGDSIQYARGGAKVPATTGCRPLPVLPDAVPKDADLWRYEALAKELVASVGAGGAAVRFGA